MSAAVLVAGVGSLFHADDAFGVHVAQHLLAGPLPEGVRVRDFGIRSIDLVHALLEPLDGVVLVDVLRRGAAPGTLYVMEPELGGAGEPPGGVFEAAAVALEVHTMNPAAVLRFCRAVGAELGWVRVLGCEPAWLSGEVEEPSGEPSAELELGLSPEVGAAVRPAAALALELAVGRLLAVTGGGGGHA